jgi:hypothetical protein
MFTSRLHRFLAGGSVLLALGGAAVPLAAVAGPAGAATVAAAAATKLAFFEQENSFRQTGSTVEFTSLLFAGTKAHHAVHWTGTDHFLCTFPAAGGAPRCEGEVALGGSMLLIEGAGGQGTFSIPIVGGTGRYQDAKGRERVQDLAGSSNSNLILTLTRR